MGNPSGLVDTKALSRAGCPPVSGRIDDCQGLTVSTPLGHKKILQTRVAEETKA